MPLRIAIFDDNKNIRESISMLLNTVEDFEVVGSYSHVLDCVDDTKECRPDIVLMDIEMPGMNGFDFLNNAGSSNFDVIFTTAYDSYAIKAIRFSALDYLLKPIDADELQNAFRRFMQRPQGIQPLYNNFMYNLHVQDKKDFKLALPTLKGIFFYKPEEIIRLEGESNYTKFFFSNKTSLLTTHTHKNL